MSGIGMWDGVPQINNHAPCDICRGMDDVERKHVWGSLPQTRSVRRQSNLCAKCKRDGWTEGIPTEHHRLAYYNIKSRKFKNV